MMGERERERDFISLKPDIMDKILENSNASQVAQKENSPLSWLSVLKIANQRYELALSR